MGEAFLIRTEILYSNINQIMKSLKILAILFVISALFGLSDLIYFYKNEPNKFAKIFLYFALRNSRQGNLDKSFSNLNKAAYFHLLQNKIIYGKDRIKIKTENDLTKFNSEARKETLDYLNKVLPKAYDNNSSFQIAMIYYNVGLIAYKSNYHRVAAALFSTAVNLEKESGHLYIELANLYFNDGETDKGKAVLQSCLQFKSPKKQCREYLDNQVRSKSFERVGIFKNIFSKFH